jgi:hypothetical protein
MSSRKEVTRRKIRKDVIKEREEIKKNERQSLMLE